MKAVIFLSLLTLASAAPKKKGPPVDPTVANEFNLDHKDSENCPGLLLLWARGTDQEGNMVFIFNFSSFFSSFFPFLLLLLLPYSSHAQMQENKPAD